MKKLLFLSLFIVYQLAHGQTPVSSSAGAAGIASTGSSAQSADQKAALSVEKQRFDAQIEKNYTVLEQVLANDLIYTHSNGNTDTKQGYIQSIRDGKSKYDAIDIEDQKVRIYGNTAVINGLCLIKAMNNGESINTHLKYTSVYVRNGSQWQMVAWQSIKLAK